MNQRDMTVFLISVVFRAAKMAAGISSAQSPDQSFMQAKEHMQEAERLKLDLFQEE